MIADHVPGHVPGRGGLRERRKERTRTTIRGAAMSLFESQGYAQTTVEQIAHAAEISHTTFFRYFASKEQVMMSDDLDEVRREALDSIEPGLGHFDLLREVTRHLNRLETADPWLSDPRRIRLIKSEPVLRLAFRIECYSTVTATTEFFAKYLGVSSDDPHLRVFMAAAGGVMFQIIDDLDGITNEHTLNRVLAAIDLLEEGLNR